MYVYNFRHDKYIIDVCKKHFSDVKYVTILNIYICVMAHTLQLHSDMAAILPLRATMPGLYLIQVTGKKC